MTERERTIIRVVGLAVHAAGFVVLLAGVLTTAGSVLLAGVLMFVVGGAWGWGMVLAASRRDAEDRRLAADRAMHAAKRGFTATFDDEPEPVRPTIVGPVGPPPGA
jgi:hypothetical protein